MCNVASTSHFALFEAMVDMRSPFAKRCFDFVGYSLQTKLHDTKALLETNQGKAGNDRGKSGRNVETKPATLHGCLFF